MNYELCSVNRRLREENFLSKIMRKSEAGRLVSDPFLFF